MTAGEATPACRVDRIRLWRFRNYSEQSVRFSPGVNVLSGPNAQGKTNLLEAVATLALSRSPRVTTSSDLISWADTECQIQGLVARPDGPAEIQLRLTRSDAPGQTTRTITVDGKRRHARALLGVCPVVLFWPEDLLLVKAGPDGRRRMLDVVISQCDPRAAADLVRYRRLLEQRNALLRQLRQRGSGSAPGDPLAIFTAELARCGGRVRVARASLVRSLQPLAAAALRELSGGHEELGLSYLADGTGIGPGTSAEEAEAALAHMLSTRSTDELARGVTLAGPHRDDLEFLLDGRPARTSGSQGQQRSIVLATKLAEVRHLATVAGMLPVLILDDVLSELDRDRRVELLRALGTGNGAQAMLSTTDAGALRGTELGDVTHFSVVAGRVEQ